MAANFGRRFEELSREAEEILSAKTQNRTPGFEGTYIDQNRLLGWQVKVQSLLSMVCGVDSPHLSLFVRHEKPRFVGDSNHGVLLRQQAVLEAAKQDYEGGYLNKIRDLIHAEVFASELQQAEELLAAGYPTPAAVVAGIVLETRLRQVCLDNNIQIGKLDKMNADLAKAGMYNTIVQKRITAVAGIRNAAAHGDTNAFQTADVRGMIDDIERFLAMDLT